MPYRHINQGYYKIEQTPRLMYYMLHIHFAAKKSYTSGFINAYLSFANTDKGSQVHSSAKAIATGENQRQGKFPFGMILVKYIVLNCGSSYCNISSINELHLHVLASKLQCRDAHRNPTVSRQQVHHTFGTQQLHICMRLLSRALVNKSGKQYMPYGMVGWRSELCFSHQRSTANLAGEWDVGVCTSYRSLWN